MAAETGAAPAAGVRNRRTRTGVVISDAMNKTIVVAVERMVKHSRYNRVVHSTTKFYAHDEQNASARGDLVTIVETRPMSRLKRWRLREVVRKASAAVSAPGTKADTEDMGRETRKRRMSEAPEGAVTDGAGSPGSDEASS